MADLSLLTGAGAPTPDPELHEAVVNEDATAAGQAVRCVRLDFDDSQLATDPLPWKPVTTVSGGGEFWPKRGDRALIAYPATGEPRIVDWDPAAGAEPDVPF